MAMKMRWIYLVIGDQEQLLDNFVYRMVRIISVFLLARKVVKLKGIIIFYFYIFCANILGTVYYINQSGNCIEVLNTEGSPLAYMLYHPTRDCLVIMREGFNVEHFSVNMQGNLTELARVKLSGKPQSLRSANNQGLVWAGSSSLAILTGI